MKTKQIRKTYFDYFISKDHELVDSGSLIPQNDPSLFDLCTCDNCECKRTYTKHKEWAEDMSYEDETKYDG